jgi:hypothetical protein
MPLTRRRSLAMYGYALCPLMSPCANVTDPVPCIGSARASCMAVCVSECGRATYVVKVMSIRIAAQAYVQIPALSHRHIYVLSHGRIPYTGDSDGRNIRHPSPALCLGFRVKPETYCTRAPPRPNRAPLLEWSRDRRPCSGVARVCADPKLEQLRNSLNLCRADAELSS